MIFTIDLEEAQINATRMVAEKFGLTVTETVELFVLTGVQEVVMGFTSPGMTAAEVSRKLQQHTERLILELKGRRSGGSLGPT